MIEQKTCPYHLGQTFQPFVNPQLDDPFSFYHLARSEEPIFYSSLFDAYVLTRYDDVFAVLKDSTRFSSADSLHSVINFTPEVIDILRQGFPFVSMVTSDGDAHKRLRAPFARVFAPDQLQIMEQSIHTVANRLVDRFIQDERADILAQFAYPLTLEVIFTIYSVPLEKMAAVKQWSHDLTELYSSQLNPDRQIECARSFIALQNFLAELIEQRRSTPGDDLISEVLKSDLSIAELVHLLIEMIVAGHKPTANLLGNALKLLLERSERWQALCDDAALIPTILEECLRYDAPTQAVIRTTTQPVTFSDVSIPANTRLLLVYGSANRDEAHFENNERFELDRFQHNNVNHLAFSHGIHRCVGAHLARREGRIALETLASRLKNLRLCSDQSFTHVPTTLNRGYAHLFLEWDAPV